jgi:hypothetical protein
MTTEQLIEKLENGYVIARKDLIYTILKLKETEYERGAENMRLRLGLILKRTRALRESKKQKAYNVILEQLSDHIYDEKQKSYYGEHLENHPDKRVRAVPEGEVSGGEGSPHQKVRKRQTF